MINNLRTIRHTNVTNLHTPGVTGDYEAERMRLLALHALAQPNTLGAERVHPYAQ